MLWYLVSTHNLWGLLINYKAIIYMGGGRKTCQQGSATDCASAVSVRVSVAVIEHHDQKQLGKKSLSPHVILLIEKVMVGGRNLESRTKADAMEEWRLLPYSLWTAQPAFLHNSE